jgi:O-methyltransferase
MINLAKYMTRTFLSWFDLQLIRRNDDRDLSERLNNLYEKYKDKTMLGREEYIANLRLVTSVRNPGCVVECGVWKGGTSAGMAEVLGSDRDYFLFDSFQGHVDPEPIDGPAAFAWQADKSGPWYFDNAVVGPEVADAAMKNSGAMRYNIIQGWFDETIHSFVPPSPIAVLRIDCDWYAGTMTCLRALFPYLAEGGIMVADGYRDWDGYAKALHEYLASYGGIARIRQYHDSLHYVVKGPRNWKDAAPMS